MLPGRSPRSVGDGGPSATEVAPLSIGELRVKLRRRLADLDRERSLIQNALTALEGERRPSPRRPGIKRDAVLRAVRGDPGVRASMLALELGMDVDRLADALLELQKAGEIKRTGMGWTAPASSFTTR
jgi:predicted Rossmann fold nucleotide-binding protein DprA/Smf involved in DNA uptake